MRLILHRFGLFAGIFLLQAPIISGGMNVSDQILIVILNAPAYAIMGLLFWQYLKMQRDENERRAEEGKRRSEDEKRRDDHDDKMIDAIVTGSKRIDEIEDDRRKVEIDRAIQNAAWIQAIDNSSKMVDALEARSGYLLQSDKENSELQVAIRAEVKVLFDRFIKVFPTDKSLDMLFDELKKSIDDAISKACEDKKKVVTELPVTNVVTINTGTPSVDDLPKAG